MLGHAQERVPAASARRAGLPPSVDQVFFRGLAKNPADRFPTSTSFAAALSQALAPSPSAALHPPAPLQAHARQAPQSLSAVCSKDFLHQFSQHSL